MHLYFEVTLSHYNYTVLNWKYEQSCGKHIYRYNNIYEWIKFTVVIKQNIYFVIWCSMFSECFLCVHNLVFLWWLHVGLMVKYKWLVLVLKAMHELNISRTHTCQHHWFSNFLFPKAQHEWEMIFFQDCSMPMEISQFILENLLLW